MVLFRLLSKADSNCDFCTKIQEFERIQESIIKQIGSKIKSVVDMKLVEEKDKHRIFIYNPTEKELIPVEKKLKD